MRRISTSWREDPYAENLAQRLVLEVSAFHIQYVTTIIGIIYINIKFYMRTHNGITVSASKVSGKPRSAALARGSAQSASAGAERLERPRASTLEGTVKSHEALGRALNRLPKTLILGPGK